MSFFSALSLAVSSADQFSSGCLATLLLNPIPTTPFDRIFAHMDQLSPGKQFKERGQITCKRSTSTDTAYLRDIVCAFGVTAYLFPTCLIVRTDNLTC